MALDKQYYVYSIDTDAFYYDDESELSKKLNVLRSDKRKNKANNKNCSMINKQISESKDDLVKLLKKNSGNMRKLRTNFINTKNVVSMFESTLTRTLNMDINEISTDIIIVKTYYFQVLNDLVQNGFEFNGEKYIYFSSSSGQVRTKKSVYIKESLWEKYKLKFMCGLTFDSINKKGGINQNKFMAYLSLISSSTDLWENFDMKRVIVVEDMTTIVNGKVDFINEKTYEIQENVIMDVEINTTDGCGMVLPSVTTKNKMIRSAWVKGLLGVFDFKKMLIEKNHNGDIIDIYGDKHNIFDDNIEIILTKSQFKLWNFYDSWKDYLEKYEENRCETGYCNEEDDEFRFKEMNYQTLQTLHDISDEDISELVKTTNDKIYNIAKNSYSQLELIGAIDDGKQKSPFQKAIMLYPELLKDSHTKKMISQAKKSLLKKARGGKILPNKAHYTFIVPDLYGFCQKLFFDGYQEGLLKNGEIYCNLFDAEDDIDVLRSPHLAMEHCIRKNVITNEISKWFVTDAIYISSHDLISKVLQADFDGDRALCVKDDVIIKNAKRLSKGVNPLVYDMKKADSKILNNYTMYLGLENAYKSGNIGFYSNGISKIWNNINDKNYCKSMNAIKLLCMENNFNIDQSKTLYMPTRPDEVNEQIKQLVKGKVPHFFKYAKDKEDKNIENTNLSTVNRISKALRDKRITFNDTEFESFDYTMLMSNKFKIESSNSKIVNHYDNFLKYRSILSKYNTSKDYNNQSFIIKIFRDNFINFDFNIDYIIDNLVIYLFKESPNKEKSIFWDAFGVALVKNLENNIKNLINCEECGKKVRKVSNNTKYCVSCKEKIEKEKTKMRVKKHREKMV